MSVERLLEAAKGARGHAYAPYSGYRVGAALLDSEGSIWAGCNVENISFGLTVCAERSAVFHMACSGRRRIAELLLLTEDGAPPCGACLQVMLEFAPDPQTVTIHVAKPEGLVRSYRLAELIPHGFRSPDVNRTEP